MRLDAGERVRLARAIAASLDGLSAAERDALWLDEAERRDAELDSGDDAGEPAENVFKALRARYA